MVGCPRIDATIRLPATAGRRRCSACASWRCPSWCAVGRSVALIQVRVVVSFVSLVQFEDDSVWGDRAAIEELAFQRRDTINFLRSLQSAPKLNKALAESNYGREDVNADRITWDRTMVEASLHYTSKTREEIVAEIENRLAIAAQSVDGCAEVIAERGHYFPGKH